jgi:hypothetical protein
VQVIVLHLRVCCAGLSCIFAVQRVWLLLLSVALVGSKVLLEFAPLGLLPSLLAHVGCRVNSDIVLVLFTGRCRHHSVS